MADLDLTKILLYVKFGTQLFEIGAAEVGKVKALLQADDAARDTALLDAVARLQRYVAEDTAK